MIGNAVPVNLGTFIANAIKEYCKNGAIKTSLFEESLPFELPNKALNPTSAPLRGPDSLRARHSGAG